jgi:hypothetical protein
MLLPHRILQLLLQAFNLLTKLLRHQFFLLQLCSQETYRFLQLSTFLALLSRITMDKINLLRKDTLVGLTFLLALYNGAHLGTNSDRHAGWYKIWTRNRSPWSVEHRCFPAVLGYIGTNSISSASLLSELCYFLGLSVALSLQLTNGKSHPEHLCISSSFCSCCFRYWC